MRKNWTILGCVLWIAGLVLSIVGLNLSGNAGQWTALIGNVIFLAGLGITGVIWLSRKKGSGE